MAGRTWAGIAAVVVALLGASDVGVGAGIEIIDPFLGDRSETCESFLVGQFGPLTMFGGAAVMTAGFITTSSSFMGSTILGHSSAKFSHTTGPTEFLFDEPVSQFGAYVATNSGADGGLVEFFGLGDQPVGSVPLEVDFTPGVAPYTWNGWASSVPITRLRFSSAGVLNGFLGFDDMQLTFVVPSPGAWLLLPVVHAGPARRRR